MSDSPNRTKADEVKRPYLYGYPVLKKSPKKGGVAQVKNKESLCRKNASSVGNMLQWQ